MDYSTTDNIVSLVIGVLSVLLFWAIYEPQCVIIKKPDPIQ